MSFDELPPNPKPPRPRKDAGSRPAPEASAAGAPPSTPTRRRRAKGEESAAAPASSPPASEPAVRTPRRSNRSKPAETSAAAPPIENPAPKVPEPTPEAPPKTPRRRRAAPSAAAEPQAASEPPAATPPAEAPVPKARRGRRPKTSAPAENTAQEMPVVEAALSETSAPETETAKPARRRAPRARKKGTAPTQEAAAGSELISPESPAAPAGDFTRISTTETAPAEADLSAETGEAETPAGRTRRRRGGRTRRGETKTGRTAETGEETPAPTVARRARTEPPAEKIDLSVGAHLVPRSGYPEIHIDGRAFPPVLFFGNVEEERRRGSVAAEVRRAARAGVHLHSTLVELTCPLTEATDTLDILDQRLRLILDADPEGYVMPRIVFVPARGWKREYPTEIAAYADGTTGDPSIAGERFWQEAERSLTALIGHLREYEWGKRVFGYHLEQGEWFQPSAEGYDRSIANRDAFRDWLREKYKHNLISLRAAWYDSDVQFHTAEIPPPAKPNPQRAFFESRRERRIIDFNAYTSENTARRLLSLARAVKKTANNNALVSVCYGYTFEFGHPFSGHLALEAVQASPAIDLICGPPSYRDRKLGGAASFPAPVDSLPLHGKLWLSEDDTKTYLAPARQDPDDFNPRLGDRFATEQAQARAMGKSLAHGTAIGWMDLWGEGWLDEDSMWERIGLFTERYAACLAQQGQPRVPEVVALIDEKSLLHVQRGELFFRKLTNGLRDTLQRAGVSYGTYLQSDLLTAAFPTEAKLYLFLTPYRLTAEQRAAIKEKLQNGRKTLAWLYAPGSCEERPSVSASMEEASTGATGFALRQQEWNSEVGSRIVEPDHAITKRLQSRELGTRERLNPSFYVNDSDAVTLAEYQGSSLPSLAVKEFATWKSVFVGDPGLPLELLRGICRFAGVHLWTPQGEDVVEIGNGWVTIHAGKDGQRTLHLPHPTGLYDLIERRLIADETTEYRFFLRAGMTRLFCVGSTEHLLRLGLPNVTLPGESRERIVQEERSDGPRDSVDLPAPLRADLATLEAVLTVDVSQLDEAFLEEEEEADLFPASALPETGEAANDGAEPGGEMMAGGRRRRRRGGRGRGRRRPGEGENKEETEASVPGEPPAPLLPRPVFDGETSENPEG